MTQKEFVTIPNIITTARGFLGIIGIIIALQPKFLFVGTAVFFLFGMLPDFLDGWVARAYDQRSRIGEFLDPLVDKILFYSVMFVHFTQYVCMPILVALLVCDLLSTGLHFVRSGGAVGYGKKKFGLQCASLGFFFLGILSLPSFNVFSDIAIFCANFLLIIAMGYALLSLRQRLTI